MRRIATIAVTALLVVGCGGGNAGRAKSSAAPTPGPACPEGTEFVRARDVIGPTPAGFEVVPGARGRLEAAADVLRRGLGERWRGYDAKVLARPRAANGTAVVVINSHERGGDDFMRGFLAAERDAGKQGEPIQVAGEEGRLHRAADGAYIAIAPAGECALVLLVATQEQLVRRTASVIGPR